MIVANDVATDMKIDVKPVAVYAGHSYDTLLIIDAISGKGMWYGFDAQWYVDTEYDYRNHNAERIEGVFGDDEGEWVAAANDKLGDYGLKLGVFDEVSGDRYELVEA